MSLAKMYLNVSLTPPPTGGESTCTTPKTPEILNSIISLTNPSLGNSYAHYQSQMGPTDLLSPASSTTSPNEENSATPFPTQSPLSHPGLPTPTSPLGVQRCFPFGPPSTNTPSPPTAELASPIQPVEATKTALIKEGLKHQIRTKLQAAGVPSDDLSDSPELKEEMGWYDLELTPEDEERRKRRRERNKVAATKCRNKKKEMTCILVNESEDVEDENLKLKTEIQRLTKEKLHLEKLLRDPSHTSNCHHTCATMGPPAPVVVVSPPDIESPLPPNATSHYEQQCNTESPLYPSPDPCSYTLANRSDFASGTDSCLLTDPICPSFPSTTYADNSSLCEVQTSCPSVFTFAQAQPNTADNQYPDTPYGSYNDDFLAGISPTKCDRLDPVINSISPVSPKNSHALRRTRHVSDSRYNPYTRSEIGEFDMSPPAVHTPSDEFRSGCGHAASNHYSIDISQGQYYPPCTFESM